MTKILILILFSISMTSCLNFEKIDAIYTIQKGGKGFIEYRFYNITSSEKGKKGKEEIQTLFKDIKENKALDLGDQFKLNSYKESLSYTKNKKLNGKAIGEYEDITHLLKIILGNNKQLLSKKQKFTMDWSGQILTLKIHNTSKIFNDNDAKDKKSRLIFRTEGVFLAGTNGQLSKDKKEVLYRVGSFKDVVLVIGELSK